MRRALLLLLLLSGCARQAPSPGEALFRRLGCLQCHSVGQEGGRYGPDLTMVGFRKSRPQLVTLSTDSFTVCLDIEQCAAIAMTFALALVVVALVTLTTPANPARPL